MNFFSSKIKKIEMKYKVTFVATLLFGILAQGMSLFNVYAYRGDDVFFLFDVGNTFSLGRWMLEILGKLNKIVFLDGNYSIPIVNGVITILFIAVTACVFVRALNIQRNISCILICGTMMCFPTVTSMMGGYMFTSPYYAFALFLAVSGTFFICIKGFNGKSLKDSVSTLLIGSGLLCCSLGIYQAFFPIALTSACVFVFFNIYKDENLEIKQLFVYCIRTAASIAVAFVLYIGINKVFLLANRIELSSYMGINSIERLRIVDILMRVPESYKQFFMPSNSEYFSAFPGITKYIYISCIFISIFLSVYLINKKIQKNKWRRFPLLLLLFVFPLCTDFIFVMVSKHETDIHTLMVYSHLMPFIFLIWLLEAVSFYHFSKSFHIASYALLGLCLFAYIRYDNKCYLKASLYQQQCFSYCTSLITQIKSTEGYTDTSPVCFINYTDINDNALVDIEEFSDIMVVGFSSGIKKNLNQYGWKVFLKTWLGFSPYYVDEDNFVDSNEIKEMPSYPDYGSIKVVNGTVVVKF